MKNLLLGLVLLTSTLASANDCTIKRLNLLLEQDSQVIVMNKLNSLGYVVDTQSQEGLTVEMGMQIQGETQRQHCTNCGLLYEATYRIEGFVDSFQNGEKSQFLSIRNANDESLVTHSKVISRNSTDNDVAEKLIKKIPSCEKLNH